MLLQEDQGGYLLKNLTIVYEPCEEQLE